MEILNIYPLNKDIKILNPTAFIGKNIENGDELEYKINAISLEEKNITTTKPIKTTKENKITLSIILVELVKILCIISTILI